MGKVLEEINFCNKKTLIDILTDFYLINFFSVSSGQL